MIALLLSLLGVGGIAGVLLKFVGVAGLKKFGGTAVNKARGLPRWFWIALGVLLACAALLWWHGHAVSNFEKDIRLEERNKVDAEWQTKFNTMKADAAAWKNRYETASNQLSQNRRNSHEADLRSISTRAGGLLNSGPGAARCGQVDNPGTSGSSSGRNPSSGTGNAGLDRVSGSSRIDLIAVPFRELVERARICDANRAEVLTWRGHDAEQQDLRQKMINEARKK